MVSQGTLDANFPTFRVLRKRTGPRILMKSNNSNSSSNSNVNKNKDEEDDEDSMMEVVYEGGVK